MITQGDPSKMRELKRLSIIEKFEYLEMFIGFNKVKEKKS